MDKLFSPEIIWFVIGLLMFLLEFTLPGLLIAFFGAGAWIVSLFCLLFNISLNWQLLIFIISSVLLLVSLRKWLKGIFLGGTDAQRDMEKKMDEFIGEKAVVISEIKNGERGKAEFHGTNWEAEADEDIAAGDRVEIVGRESIILKVKKLPK